jgi:hypothetical protein
MSSPVKINDLRPVFSLEKTKCREQDSNLHTLRYQILSLARLPIPPSRPGRAA